MYITRIRHSYPTLNGDLVDRPRGMDEYTFLHFYQSVNLLVGDQLIRTEPGAVMLYDMHVPQYYQSSDPLIHDWIHMRGEVAPILQECNIEFGKVYYPKNPSVITDLIYALEVEFYSNKTHRSIMLNHKFDELIIQLSRAVNTEPLPDFSTDIKRRLQGLRTRMIIDLYYHFSTEEMADLIGLSPSRLYDVYKKYFGISPNNDMINVRIDRAQAMLLDNKLTVAYIAKALGYHNTTHFIRQFKDRTGLTPTQYRKQNF